MAPGLRLAAFLFLAIIYFSTGASVSGVFREWKFHNCSFENVSECARIVILYGARELTLPDNEKDMVPHCNEEKSAAKCVSVWGRKCLKGFPRQALSVVLSGAAKNIKDRCSKNGTRWYLNNFKCVNESAEGLHNCVDTLKAELFTILKVEAKNNWLPTACCFVDKMKQCFDKGIAPFCDKEGQTFLHWCREGYIGNLGIMGCTPKNYGADSDRCKALVDAVPKTDDNGKGIYLPSALAAIYKIIVEVVGE